MDAHAIFRQLLRAPATHRTFLQASTRPQSRTVTHACQQRYLSLPRIVTPSFWASLIPKPLRGGSSSSPEAIPTSVVNPHTGRREWNPATPYIILALLVGSQAIQILWLKRDRLHFTRRSEAKIGVLREVIERVQKGEDVDVEGVLGSGDAGKEAEWESVMREIESEELLWRSKKRRRAMREEAQKAEAAAVVEGETAKAEEKSEAPVKAEVYKGARFY